MTTDTVTLPPSTSDQPALRSADTDRADATLPAAVVSSCCGNDDGGASTDIHTMRTDEFLATVRAAGPDQRLIFLLDGTPLVSPGYHVTEVKSVAYETMDCGGLADRWRETVIQLWNPGDDPVREHMAAAKFLAIYDRVAVHVAVVAEAELRFEYGDPGQPAINYHVAGVEARGETLLVHLRAPAVTCKARDRDALACRVGGPGDDGDGCA